MVFTTGCKRIPTFLGWVWRLSKDIQFLWALQYLKETTANENESYCQTTPCFGSPLSLLSARFAHCQVKRSLAGALGFWKLPYEPMVYVTNGHHICTHIRCSRKSLLHSPNPNRTMAHMISTWALHRLYISPIQAIYKLYVTLYAPDKSTIDKT